MAGEDGRTRFGTGIRSFNHSQLQPYAGRIVLHPELPYMFVLNSYNQQHLHRGFTFNTHNKSFKGAWGPDPRVSHLASLRFFLFVLWG